MKWLRITLVILCAVALHAQNRADALKNLVFRNIGPANMGGRVDDIAVVESNPSTYYIGLASGGIWKTTNGGVTFEPIFDHEAVHSIADLAIAPSDPQIIYAGTGEQNNRQSSSWGNGVYKSLDGGRTWQHLGLKDTHHIGRLVVHPRNPNVVYVAAAGRLWGPHPERGVFKSTDGGKSWSNVKFINEDTGFIDIAMDPESPDTLYAAAYQRRRQPFGYNGGGPGSGLWKTVDGGTTWTKLSRGLPAEGDVGRIGVTVYRKDPRIVYALIEHQRMGGTYRSEDRGESWTRMSDTNPRPSYYSKIHVDPNNDQRIWVLAAQMFYSEDGGRTFRTNLVSRIHGDYHGLWINPADSNHVLTGSDGGIHVSYDRGRSWNFMNTMALAQFYEVHADMRKPYYVCGGLQDNGSWCGPSRTMWTQGISNEEWYRVGGGDGFFTVIDPTDHHIVYVESQDGNLRRMNLRSFESKSIRPLPPEGQRYRFNWNSPLVISPHDPKTVYYGGNRLFISNDRGDTWTPTQDLTSGVDRDRRQIFGRTSREFLSRNDGVVHYSTITTISESPVKAGVLWVGTDDGNVWVSTDGGKKWNDLISKVPGVPKETYVSRVEASRRGPGSAYLAFDGHRGNDFKPYLYLTDDYGQTWKSIAANLPEGGTISVVREHPRTHDLLFVGTEFALWASWNRGGEWHRLKGNLPTTPIDDIYIHPRDNDLILGTHGRGVWILDDIAALEQLADPVLTSELHLFDVRPAAQYRLYGNKGNTGHQVFLAPNPPEGALITYYLKSQAGGTEVSSDGPALAPGPAAFAGGGGGGGRGGRGGGRGAEGQGGGRAAGGRSPVLITITDASGAVVRELRNPPRQAGVNRINWDLRYGPPFEPEEGETGFGGGGFGGPPRGPLVMPGTYTVKIAMGQTSVSKTVTVEEDPRIQISPADRKLWHDSQVTMSRVVAQIQGANRAVTALRRQFTELRTALERRRDTPDTTRSALRSLADKVDAIGRRISRQAPQGFAGAPLADDPDPVMQRVTGLAGSLNSYTAAPTAQQKADIEQVTRLVGAIVADVNAVIEKDVPALNKTLLDSGIGKLDPGRRVP